MTYKALLIAEREIKHVIMQDFLVLSYLSFSIQH